MLDLDIGVQRRDFSVEVALRVAEGERFALFGPSGSGKTTLLEAVAGLVRLQRGSVILGVERLSEAASGLQVAPWRRQVALLRQEAALFTHLDVRANLCYSRRGPAPTASEVGYVVDLLELGGLLGARPQALSGGQAQRVALGRVLLSGYRALLLDEPYSGLDARLRRRLTDLARSEIAARGVPGVLVAHELAEAQAFADRLGVLDAGRLLQEGSPHEVVRRPASRRVAELVGYRGFVPASAVVPGRSGAGNLLGVHPDMARPGEHSSLGPVLRATVRSLRPSGAVFEADIEVPGARVPCRLYQAVAPGSLLSITLVDPPVFGPDGVALPERAALR